MFNHDIEGVCIKITDNTLVYIVFLIQYYCVYAAHLSAYMVNRWSCKYTVCMCIHITLAGAYWIDDTHFVEHDCIVLMFPPSTTQVCCCGF